MFIVKVTTCSRWVAYAIDRQLVGCVGYAARYSREDAERVAADHRLDPHASVEIIPATSPQLSRDGWTFRNIVAANQAGRFDLALRLTEREFRV
jgi:hypothetical protein